MHSLDVFFFADFLLLLASINVLLAILVDAYVEVKGEASNATTIANDLAGMMPKFGTAANQRMDAEKIVTRLARASAAAAAQRRSTALEGLSKHSKEKVLDEVKQATGEESKKKRRSFSRKQPAAPKLPPSLRVGRAEINEGVLLRVLRRYGNSIAGVGTGDAFDARGAQEFARAVLHTLHDNVADRGEMAQAAMDAEGFQTFVLKEFQKLHSNFNELELFQRQVLERLGLEAGAHLTKVSSKAKSTSKSAAKATARRERKEREARERKERAEAARATAGGSGGQKSGRQGRSQQTAIANPVQFADLHSSLV